MGDEGEDLGDQALLDGCFLLLLAFYLGVVWGMYELGVEFCQPWLAGIVEN